jgi:hypothetical protein
MKYLLLAGGIILAAVACRKTATTDINIQQSTGKVVVDYVMCNEGMYLMKYKPVYNRYMQVASLLRGEQFAPESQLQEIAVFHYHDQQQGSIPDSVSVFNVHHKVAGVIKDGYNVVAQTKKDTAYRYPERRNRFLETTGAYTLMLVAGKNVDWAGSGHLGGNGSINIMGYLHYFNQPTLKDTITNTTNYGNVEGLQLQFNNTGYPIRVDYTDNYNAAYTHMFVGYREL